MSTVRGGERVLAGRVRLGAGLAISLALAGVLSAIAFVGNGGLQLGSATLVEIGVIVVAGLVVAAALLFAADAPLHGGATLAALVALAGLTGLSILWSLHPADSWIETNRTLAYVGAFAAGIAAVRLAPARWEAVLYGVLLALTVVSLYGLLTKVAPGWLAEDEIYGRLREPYGYWNAVGITAAMAIPLCLWLGTRPGPVLPAALAHPLLGLLMVTMLLSFSRGSILAALVAIGIWLAVVPQRLKTLAVLLPAAAGAALVTVWAFGNSALTDDRVPLARREDAGVEFGLVLLGMTVLLLVAGVLIERRARERPLPERTRRTLGKLALGSLAAVPLIVLAALAFSDRGIGGTVSDRWDDLTSKEQAPSNEPGRLIETGNVRTIYWSRALDVWREHRLAGRRGGCLRPGTTALPRGADPGPPRPWLRAPDAGRPRPARPGAPVSRRSSPGWSRPLARSTCGGGRLRTGLPSAPGCCPWPWWRSCSACTRRSTGPGSFRRSRSPASSAPAGSPAGGRLRSPPRTPRPARPRPPACRCRAGALLRGRAALAAGAVVLAGLTAVAVAQPWRADDEGDQALALLSEGNFAGARAAADRAHDINPLSIEPYFEQAEIERAAGRPHRATRPLEDAVRLEPASPEAWRRLGDHYVTTLDQPERAIPVLRAALFLDPTSALNRAAYLVALRARGLKRAEALAAARAEAARRAARRKARAAPAEPKPPPAP